MKLMFKLQFFIVIALSAILLSCSSDDDSSSVDVTPYITEMSTKLTDLETLKSNSQFGDKKGMYPEESKYILDDAIIQVQKNIRLFKNGSETAPSQAKVDEVIAAANKAMTEFKVTIRTEDVKVTEYQLFVDGKNAGFIDFGRHEEYSRFGNDGKQAFTVELWYKLESTNGFSAIVSCFNEDGGARTRKGWFINNFDHKRVRMSLGFQNWGLSEPGFDYNTTKQWAHFAAVVDENGVDGEMNGDKPVIIKLYLNGELMDKATALDGGLTYLSNDELTRMIAFGQSGKKGEMTEDWRMSGWIKDFHIWKSAKSEEMIKKIMNKEVAVTGEESDLVCGWSFTKKPEDDKPIKDLTGKFSATIVGEHKWEVVE